LSYERSPCSISLLTSWLRWFRPSVPRAQAVLCVAAGLRTGPLQAMASIPAPRVPLIGIDCHRVSAVSPADRIVGCAIDHARS